MVTVPVSATPKLQPMMPMSLFRNLSRRMSRAWAVSVGGSVVGFTAVVVFVVTALFGLILVVGWSMVRPAGPAAPAGGGAAAGTVDPNAQGVTDITQMTPREAADRLFNRVMTTISQGDTAGAMGFQPMAVQAYQRAEPLDLDGLYHQALLELLADPAAALATAQRILEAEPNHILGLGVAARASLSLGDEEAARGHYQQLLDAYDEEAPRTLNEYVGHQNLLTEYRAEARSFLDGA